MRRSPGIRRVAPIGRFALATLAAVVAQAAQGGVAVEAYALDAAVLVKARAVVRASPELVWHTLTDYESLPQFVPGIASSRVVSRRGLQRVIEQSGDVRLWPFSYPVHVVVSCTERPFQRIEVHLLEGNLRRFEGGYLIEPAAGGGTQLTWSGLIEPTRPLPDFVRTALLRRSIAQQFGGMVREIERRALSAPGGPTWH